ncbi:melanin-concentrating hormone receptor 1-like [Petromyzon marinus]|uniref:melanin-concentrating hormone receptor 1-like n=1 Tax=Petromyzon marinus TaxID=7757 RepID=UPI003F70F87D
MSNSTFNVSGDAAASSSHAPLQATYVLLCVCGVTANGAVICALACGGGGKRRHVSDAYVFNLAVADLLFLLGMPFLAHQLVSEQRWRFGWFMCKALTLVDVNNQYTSVGTVTVLCIDRYIAVAHPLTAATNRTMRGAFLVNLLVWLCSLLLSLPAPVYASVLHIDGVEVCALDFPEARLGATAFAVANFALAFAAPLALISVFYALALRRVSSATRRGARLRPQNSRSRRATRTAVAIVVAFAACWAPFHAMQMVGLTLSEPTDGFHLAYQLSICLGYAHSCINPVLLIFFTEFFKERLPCARFRARRQCRYHDNRQRRRCCCCRRRRRSCCCSRLCCWCCCCWDGGATSGDVGKMPGKAGERRSAWCSDRNAAGDDGGGGDDEEVAAATLMTTTSTPPAVAAAPMGEGSDARVQEQLHVEEFTTTCLSVSLVEAAPAMPTPSDECLNRSWASPMAMQPQMSTWCCV